MKRQLFILTLGAALLCTRCSNDKNKKYNVNDDPAKFTVPDNSSATNPSLADTAYVNKDTVKKHDSTKK